MKNFNMRLFFFVGGTCEGVMANFETICIICNQELKEDTVIVTKGLKTIYDASLRRKDGLHEKLGEKTAIKVNKSCRQQ